MKISAGGDHIANIDTDAKADASRRRGVGIVIRHKPLHLDRAADGAVDTVEHDQ
jgi:hypothetical protein